MFASDVRRETAGAHDNSVDSRTQLVDYGDLFYIQPLLICINLVRLSSESDRPPRG
jgi:hypothetical protein